MSPLTLQEVIDRINQRYQYTADDRAITRSHHPEFYVPRITRFFAGLLFGAFPASDRIAVAREQSGPQSIPS